jgi:hypothetical protein
MKRTTRIPKVTGGEDAAPDGLRLTFDDGVVRDADLSSEPWGPMFEPLRDPECLAQVVVDHCTVSRSDGADLGLLVLHGDFEAAAISKPRRFRSRGDFEAAAAPTRRHSA